MPEVLRHACHLTADRAGEDVGEDGLLDGGHVDTDAGDGLFVLRFFAHGNRAADRVAGFVAGREGIAPGGVPAVAIAGRDRLRGRDERGVRSEVDEIHAELAVDETRYDLLGAGDHWLSNGDGVGSDRLDRVGVDGLGHTDAGHRGLQDERLAGGEAAAERKHHDAGEADADNEHPALAGAEDARGLGGAMDVDDRDIGDERRGDGRDEAGELADDLTDDGGLVAGRSAWRSAGDREYRAQHLRRPVVAGIEGAPAHVIGVGGLRESRAGPGQEEE